MIETMHILKGAPPKNVGEDNRALCDRLRQSASSGDISDMGAPLNMHTLNFSDQPRSLDYGCPLEGSPRCTVARIIGANLVPRCFITINQVVDPKGGFMANSYEVPPAAESIVQCETI